MDVRQFLYDLGHSQLLDYGDYWRCKPLYRDSVNPTSFSVNKETGWFHDFKTGENGSPDRLVYLITGKNGQKWLEKNNYNPSFEEKILRPTISPPIKKYPPQILDNLIKDYSFYKNRGISEQTLQTFQCGIAYKDKFKNRIVFPIFDDRGQSIIGFAGRDLTNNSLIKWKIIGPKKYLAAPFYLTKSYILESKQLILVESIGDGLALWEAGIRNFLVLLGLELLPGVFRKCIATMPNQIIIATNNDEDNGGRVAAAKIKKTLDKHFPHGTVSVNLPPRGDFGDMTKKEVQHWYDKREVL